MIQKKILTLTLPYTSSRNTVLSQIALVLSPSPCLAVWPWASYVISLDSPVKWRMIPLSWGFCEFQTLAHVNLEPCLMCSMCSSLIIGTIGCTEAVWVSEWQACSDLWIWIKKRHQVACFLSTETSLFTVWYLKTDSPWKRVQQICSSFLCTVFCTDVGH